MFIKTFWAENKTSEVLDTVDLSLPKKKVKLIDYCDVIVNVVNN